MSFVHLHVHSHYSLLQASCTVDALVQKCSQTGQRALALTDYGNLFGALEFYFKCKDRGIQPIIGLEVYLTSNLEKKDKKTSHRQKQTLVLLVQNPEGYKNICSLSTIGYQKGFYYIPRVDMKTVEKHSNGLIALTGGRLGSVLKKFENFGEEKALEEIKQLKKIFKDRLYLEYTKTNPAPYNQFLKSTADKIKIPLAAAGDVHYVEKADAVVQDVLTCIGGNTTLEDNEREKLPSHEFYFKTPEQMKALFKDDPAAVSAVLEIADRCRLEFKLKDKLGRPIHHLPVPVEKKKNLTMELQRLAQAGLKERLKNLELDKDLSKIREYEERLKKELKIINSMGFTGYFLIVHEFVHWAKKLKIPVGPGRGSGASSLAAYSLGITDLDPMPQNLLFERFLNPERMSMPDFDIDFCQENRNRVIKHVHDTYGKDYVAQVITFGRLQAKAAIRDVGRILGMRYLDVDAIAKLVPDQLGVTIRSAVEQSNELRERMETDSQVTALIELAGKIEGLARHVSIHAAGVIITDQPILNYAPLYKGAENENVIQYDLKYAKKIGLVKFDFLGLKTLTHIHEACRLIQANRNKKIEPADIELEDQGIYEIMNKGDTLGIFQFEGYGITDLIRKAKPKCFEDIVAINALFRPGPMDMIGLYLERRKSKTARYIFPELEPILKETHGIVVYQEQVLLISAVIAGYSFAEADILRRAMAEKIPSEMEKQKSRFLRGAKEKGFDLKKSEELFDKVAEFAKYGFNKAHAAAYCVLAAQTAWLKHYYPVEFFASLLTTEMADTDKVTKYIKNALEKGVRVLSPHINHSKHSFTAKGDEIYFALGAIKGVGQAAVENILQIKKSLEGEVFKSFDQFLESVDFKKVNKKTMDSLGKAGAFDGLGYDRAEIIYNLSAFMERAESKKRDKQAGQGDLFSFGGQEEQVSLVEEQSWTSLEQLNHEKDVIGFYLSRHPLDYFKPITQLLLGEQIQNVKKNNTAGAKIWGMLSDLRETITRKGSTMAFARLEDQTGSLDLVFFSKIYLDFEKLLKTNEPVYVEGRLKQDDSSRCVVEKVTPLSFVLEQVRGVEIYIPESAESSVLDQLKKVMKESEGKTTVLFKLNVEGASLNLKSRDPGGLNLNLEVLEKIKKLIPAENIRLL